MREERRGVSLEVRGVVQGVGFRPHVCRLARRHGITGGVYNTGFGVVIEAEGPTDALFAFLEAVRQEAPPLASITDMDVRAKRPAGCTGFEVIESRKGGARSADVPPDVATCDDCLRELFDPKDRRFGYPFINCTNCGPRYTVIRSVPYDRERTSMEPFPLCADCSREYHDVGDRRFHAETNACPACGPGLLWAEGSGRPERGETGEVLCRAARALGRGRILAVKGLGGFHLAVDAASDEAVSRLRCRKGRPDKPLAVMVRDMDAARRIAVISEAEAGAVCSRERPIVLVPRRKGSGLSDGIAPGIRDLGVMLPYTPLHHLLFAREGCPDVLVMTSANVSDEPICTGNDEALDRLSGIADAFLLHDREIVARLDDSILQFSSGASRMIRRSRGYVPRPLSLSCEMPPVLACGGDLKNSFAHSRGDAACFGPHMGDLAHPLAFDAFSEAVVRMEDLLDVEPVALVCDLHPDYASTRYAESRGLPVLRVQHHHAHAAAVMAEFGLDGPVLAVCLDGTGYGPDGTIWGGEVLQADRFSYRRIARLGLLPLPGGDRAAREPWRMAASALFSALGAREARDFLGRHERLDPVHIDGVLGMLAVCVNSPLTSSCGRLFDAVSAILGLRFHASYEAQAAMELETLAWTAAGEADSHDYPVSVADQGGIFVLDSLTLVRSLVADVRLGTPAGVVASRFHRWLAAGISRLVKGCAARTGLKTVVLAGGCMYNRILLDGLMTRLAGNGLRVFAGQEVPAGDGGLALGQLLVGGSLLSRLDPYDTGMA